MHAWTVHDAKARFVEMLEARMFEGPQLVTRRGAEVAVLVPVHEWRRLKADAHASLKPLLLDDSNRIDMLIPARDRAPNRRVGSPG